MKQQRPIFWIVFWVNNWIKVQRARRGRAFYLRYLGPFVILFMLSLGQYYAQRDLNRQSLPSYLTLPVTLTNEDSQGPETARLDSLVGRFMDRWEISAASLAIIRDGNLVHARGYGYTDSTHEETTNPNHLFRIASVSKLITAAAVLKLVDQGKLRLDHPVFGDRGYLKPEHYGEAWQQRAYEITVRHLLEHTSGFSWRTLGDPAFKLDRVARDLETPLPISRPQLIQWQLNQHIPYKPGTRFSYSNVGYIILHEVIKQASGMSYEAYVDTNLLAPAGIQGMCLGKTLLQHRHPQEVMYFDHPGAPLRSSVVGSDTLVPRQYGGTDIELLGGAGGWIASAEDLARLVVAMDGDPTTPDVISQESVKEMTKRGGSRLPLGWRSVYGDRWIRTGSLSGTNAVIYRLDSRTTYIFIINQSQWNGYRFNRTLDGALKKAIATISNWPERDLFNQDKVIRPAQESLATHP